MVFILINNIYFEILQHLARDCLQLNGQSPPLADKINIFYQHLLAITVHFLIRHASQHEGAFILYVHPIIYFSRMFDISYLQDSDESYFRI